jgi:hypothetical protein
VAEPHVALAHARREAIAGDAHEVARHDIGEHDGGRGHLAEIADRAIALDLAAGGAQLGDEGVGDRLRATRGERPAGHVSEGGKEQPYAGGGRPVERQHGVGGGAGEQRRGVGLDEVPSGECRRRTQGVQPEPSHHQRMVRERERRQHVVDEADAGVDDGPEQSGPRLAVRAEAGAGRLDRSLEQDGVVVERVGNRYGRLDPSQPLAIERQRAHRFGDRSEGVDRRTDVVDEARFGELGAAGSAAWRRLPFEDQHAPPAAGDRDGGDEPVRTRTDDDGVVLNRHRARHGRRASVSCACSISSVGASRRTSSSAPSCWPP